MSNTQPSQVPLVAALEGVGLRQLAARAANNEFHDYLTPHAMPQHVLVNALSIYASRFPGMRAAILAIRNDVIDGKYDATKAESDEWVKSPDGQATLDQLFKRERDG